MHELALSQQIVVAIRERLGEERRISRVVLEVGRLSGAMPQALRFSFQVCVQDTPLEGAELEIIEIAGLLRCHECGKSSTLEAPVVLCACGSANVEILGGQELRIKEVEVSDV